MNNKKRISKLFWVKGLTSYQIAERMNIDVKEVQNILEVGLAKVMARCD